MRTYEQMRAEWIDDRASLRSRCEHDWIMLERDSGTRRVFCTKCEKRPHCAPSIFDSRQRSVSTHAQGETDKEALWKAALAYALSMKREPYESPYICRFCGFWTI